MEHRTRTHQKPCVSHNIIIHPEAEVEMTEAFDWYEARIPGLGSNFLLSLMPFFIPLPETQSKNNRGTVGSKTYREPLACRLCKRDARATFKTPLTRGTALPSVVIFQRLEDYVGCGQRPHLPFPSIGKQICSIHSNVWNRPGLHPSIFPSIGNHL